MDGAGLFNAKGPRFMDDVVFTDKLSLRELGEDYASVHVVTDSNVARLVLPGTDAPCSWNVVVLQAGEENKNLDALSHVWRELTAQGATRGSLVVNIGGGVVTDLGGFAAATYQRGVDFVNVPTTLLAMVDASTGGKTAIDFDGLKNQIGVFAAPSKVIICPRVLATLPRVELLSGYGEVMKHALLEGRTPTPRQASAELEALVSNPSGAVGLLRRDVAVKQRLVASDPRDRGARQALNLGHTVGHALEAHFTLARRKKLPHGIAVAYGLLVELVLSHTQLGFPSCELYPLAETLRSLYAPVAPLGVVCEDYPELLRLMGHDKKNAEQSRPAFSLLSSPGVPALGQTPGADAISAALDIARDLLGE